MKHDYKFMYDKELTEKMQILLRRYCCYDLCRMIDRGYLLKDFLEEEEKTGKSLTLILKQLNTDYEKHYKKVINYVKDLNLSGQPADEYSDLQGVRSYFIKMVNQVFLDKIENRMKEEINHDIAI